MRTCKKEVITKYNIYVIQKYAKMEIAANEINLKPTKLWIGKGDEGKRPTFDDDSVGLIVDKGRGGGDGGRQADKDARPHDSRLQA